MNLPKDKQGHLEDLNTLTLPQLKELLERQEKILSRKKFLSTLPDRGEKPRLFAEQLRKLIDSRNLNERQSCDARLGTTGILQWREESKDKDQQSSISKDRDEAIMESLTTRNENNTTYNVSADDSSKEIVKQKNESMCSEDLAQQMQELSVGTKAPTDSHVANSYERVIKKAELNPTLHKERFIPNKPLREKVPNPSVSRSKPDSVPEESAVRPPMYTHHSTKLISVEESVRLIEEQRKKTERLAAERAAQRLAEQLSTKMTPYRPAAVDMGYRNTQEDEDEDRDSDDFPSDDDDEVNDDDDASDDDNHKS